jgi:hypothetical protein
VIEYFLASPPLLCCGQPANDQRRNNVGSLFIGLISIVYRAAFRAGSLAGSIRHWQFIILQEIRAMQLRHRFLAILFFSATSLNAEGLWAHFTFLCPGEGDQILLFFGENLADRTYHLPVAIKNSQLTLISNNDKREQLAATSIDSDDFVGLIVSAKLQTGDMIVSTATYGIYHGSKLDYTSCLLTSITDPKPVSSSEDSPPFRSRVSKTSDGIELLVTWKGQPLCGASVILIDSQGVTRGEGKTDEKGRLSFLAKEIDDGLNALVIGHKIDQGGQWEGKEYGESSHYLTVTFPYIK